MNDADIVNIRKSLYEEIRVLAESVKALKKKLSAEEAFNNSLREEHYRLVSELESAKKKLVSTEHEIQRKLERIKYFEDMKGNLAKTNEMIAKSKADIYDAKNLLKVLLYEEAELKEKNRHLKDLMGGDGAGK